MKILDWLIIIIGPLSSTDKVHNKAVNVGKNFSFGNNKNYSKSEPYTSLRIHFKELQALFNDVKLEV